MKSFIASLSVMLLLALSPSANADIDNPFSMSKVSADQMQIADNHSDNESSNDDINEGESEKKATCGSGRCGNSDNETTCGSGKSKKDKDKKMNCGSGRCGSN